MNVSPTVLGRGLWFEFGHRHISLCVVSQLSQALPNAIAMIRILLLKLASNHSVIESLTHAILIRYVSVYLTIFKYLKAIVPTNGQIYSERITEKDAARDNYECRNTYTLEIFFMHDAAFVRNKGGCPRYSSRLRKPLIVAARKT